MRKTFLASYLLLSLLQIPCCVSAGPYVGMGVGLLSMGDASYTSVLSILGGTYQAEGSFNKTDFAAEMHLGYKIPFQGWSLIGEVAYIPGSTKRSQNLTLIHHSTGNPFGDKTLFSLTRQQTFSLGVGARVPLYDKIEAAFKLNVFLSQFKTSYLNVDSEANGASSAWLSGIGPSLEIGYALQENLTCHISYAYQMYKRAKNLSVYSNAGGLPLDVDATFSPNTHQLMVGVTYHF